MREEDEYNTQQACILVLLPGLLHVQTVTCRTIMPVLQESELIKMSQSCLDLNTTLFF
jgi:hypothetical protein